VYTARDATAALKSVVELMDGVSTDRNGCSLVSYRSRQMGMAFIDSPLIIGKASLVVYRYTQGHGGFGSHCVEPRGKERPRRRAPPREVRRTTRRPAPPPRQFRCFKGGNWPLGQISSDGTELPFDARALQLQLQTTAIFDGPLGETGAVFATAPSSKLR